MHICQQSTPPPVLPVSHRMAGPTMSCTSRVTLTAALRTSAFALLYALPTNCDGRAGARAQADA